jgi:hypothetical protein
MALVVLYVPLAYPVRDADRTVSSFAVRVTCAVDLVDVQAGLAGVVQEVLEPARVPAWVAGGAP